ncbi:MAG: signal peptidase I [Allobaculum sp.]|nr:signal peptidase I [Allobaculum sp.]
MPKPEAKKKTKESTFLGDVLDFVKILAGCSICVLFFLNFIAHPVNVSGHSMDPSLADGEYGFTSIISVALSQPERGDIVISNQEGANGETERWVKRVIGLPGETIEAKNGVVYIDGEPLDESSYLNEDYIEETLAKYQAEHGVNYGTFTSDFGPVTLGEDEYWVMGDNRPYSKDSRYIGPISSDTLFGKGLLVLYPFNKAGIK